jgi:glycosyltransferase involved in cell wall biosynthesis
MERKVKVVYIISEINKAIAFEWIAEYINNTKFELSFILLNPGVTDLEKHLTEKGLSVKNIIFRGKRDWFSAIRQTYKILRKIKPDAIHCHMMQANIIGLSAGKLAGIKKRIYTRHHSSLHHVYFPKGVLWDKYFNRMATHIVAISDIVKKILINWEKANPKKIILIPHGFLLDDFAVVAKERVERFKRNTHINGKYPVIGVISRFTEWKGVQYVIPAFNEILKDFPNAVLILLNAHGDYENTIFSLLQKIPNQSFRTVRFENDIAAVYKSMDIFVHVPIDEHSEAFGQIYIESLASGVPSIFTLSGIAPDFIVNKYNAVTVPFKNSTAINTAALEILKDQNLQINLKKNGIESVSRNFGIQKMIDALEKLYNN